MIDAGHDEDAKVMIVGLLQVELAIDGAQSLKDKRRVVVSLKDRLHREHQVAVAEVDHLENHQLAMLGMAMVSNEVSHCQSMLDRIVEKIRTTRGCALQRHQIEIIPGS